MQGETNINCCEKKCNDQIEEAIDEESCYEKTMQQANGGSWCDKCSMNA
jgi:hypothetical protein